MAPHCKGICHHFFNYRGGGTGPNLYRNNLIFCRMCQCAYTFTGVFCPCCGIKVRHNSWSSKYRQKRLQQLYAHAIEVGEEIEEKT